MNIMEKFIVAFDQKNWIELARDKDNGIMKKIFNELTERVKKGELILPLHFSRLHETLKQYRIEKRKGIL